MSDLDPWETAEAAEASDLEQAARQEAEEAQAADKALARDEQAEAARRGPYVGDDDEALYGDGFGFGPDGELIDPDDDEEPE